MILYVLDTDHVSLFQKNHPAVVRHIKTVDPSQVAVTIITFEEQMRGWFTEIRRHSDEKVTWAYLKMRAALAYFHSVHLLDFDPIAYAQFAQLRQQKIRIGSQDLRIAAIALSLHATLVTRNRKDFIQVPGLPIEDWTT